MRTRLISSSNPVPPPSKVRHQPVLLHEVIRALGVLPDDVIVDATLGGAGHAQELAKGLGGNGLFIGFDMDHDAVERAQECLAGLKAPVHLICANFRDLEKELAKLDVTKITKVLFDLGWSSYQLDSGRGFSFQADEPLLMTYGKEPDGGTLTAEKIVNTWAEGSLADVIYGFGEERYSRRIAKAIVERRARSPFKTSRELAEFIKGVVPKAYAYGRIHPATRTFQALRIAVNDELSALSEGLASAWKLLAPGGRIAVISFHSIEDRIVKQTFFGMAKRGEGTLITRKPLRPTAEETADNPRARSAKLRVIQKISYESSDTKNKQIRSLDFSGET